MSLIAKAKSFATAAHGAIGQKRKYTLTPYIEHPAAVVAILNRHGIKDEVTICAAWMHDTIEDTPIDISEIRAMFGAEIADMVFDLTDTPTMKNGPNRAARKALDRERLASADYRVQNIKVADMIDNTTSIVEHDPDFAKVYMREKRTLLGMLLKAKLSLRDEAGAFVDLYFRDNGDDSHKS